MVSISLKSINGTTYEEARGFLVKTINEEARRLSFLSKSPKLDETEQELLNQLKKKKCQMIHWYIASGNSQNYWRSITRKK